MALLEQNTKPLPRTTYLVTPRVTFAELEVAKIVILDCFKDLFIRHKLMAETMQGFGGTQETSSPIEQYQNIKKFFLSLYFEERAHTLFIPANLLNLAENIFTNDDIRDFVLNWTDMCMISLSVQDYNLENLRETISQGVCQNKLSDKDNSDKSLSLVNEKVALAIQLSPDYVKETLAENSWLLCLTILYLFMSEVNIVEMI